jgi:hypothetical protein
MKTLETDQELLKGLQEYQREQRRKPEPLYHPIGSVSHTQRIETKEGWKKHMVSLEPTFFITFLFNRRFDNQNIEQITTYGEKKIRMFNRYIHRKILGRYWYKPEIIDPDEHIKMYLFPQDIKTNPHYHGVVVMENSKMFPNKIKMFQEHSNRIWNTNKELSTGGRDVIVPNGSLDIQPPECSEKVSRYSTREHDYFEYHEHHIIL